MSFSDRKKYEKIELLKKHEKEESDLKKKHNDEIEKLNDEIEKLNGEIKNKLQTMQNRHLKEEKEMKMRHKKEDIEFEITLFNQLEKIEEKERQNIEN